MATKTGRTIKTFVKFVLYTFAFIVATQIVNANTIELDWKTVLTAAALGTLKAVLTWIQTPEVTS